MIMQASLKAFGFYIIKVKLLRSHWIIYLMKVKSFIEFGNFWN